MEVWLNKNWRALIQGEVQQIFYGKGYFAFIFEKKEDRDLIFRNVLVVEPNLPDP